MVYHRISVKMLSLNFEKNYTNLQICACKQMDIRSTYFILLLVDKHN